LFGGIGIIVLTVFTMLTVVRQTNVYEKIRSFSCRISPASGDLQLAWSDEPPNQRDIVNFEGGYAILLTFAAIDLPREATVNDSPNLKLKILEGEDEGRLSVSLNGVDIPVKRLLVIDPTGERNFSRPVSQIELQSILNHIRNNMLGCIERPLNYVDISDV
jgi:hypothetical protein